MLNKQFRQAKNKNEILNYEDYFSETPEKQPIEEIIDRTKPTYEEYIEKIKAYLSPEEFNIFYCVFIEELSFKQTSLILNMNINTVKTRARRLKMKLQKFLSDYSD